jgi:hypothetical protein
LSQEPSGLQAQINPFFMDARYRSVMAIQSPKLTPSSVYLNLLQARPVRPAAVTSEARPQAPAKSVPAPAPGRGPVNLPRGRIIDIIA